jgi:hypothetical protein
MERINAFISTNITVCVDKKIHDMKKWRSQVDLSEALWGYFLILMCFGVKITDYVAKFALSSLF